MEVLVNLPVGTDQPKVLDDFCPWGREPRGEYFFYYATDSNVIANGKVDASLAPHSRIEAYVSFEKDSINVGSSMRQYIASGAYGPTLDGRAFLDERIDTPIDMWEDFPHYPVIGALSGDEACASWFDFNRWGGSNLGLSFVKLESDRIITISAWSNDPDALPRELLDHWERIVPMFANIPYKRFSGALSM